MICPASGMVFQYLRNPKTSLYAIHTGNINTGFCVLGQPAQTIFGKPACLCFPCRTEKTVHAVDKGNGFVHPQLTFGKKLPAQVGSTHPVIIPQLYYQSRMSQSSQGMVHSCQCCQHL